MFSERAINQSDTGWIEVICGCMFSGKTEELIRRVRRAEIAGLSIIVFKPKTDSRYHDSNVVSHNKTETKAIAVFKSVDILDLVSDQHVICIDEAQFFDDEIVAVCNKLANYGKRVIVAGLDMDFKGRPFGPMPFLMAVAEYVTKLHAICIKTGGLASYSFRKSDETAEILLGENDIYEARGRSSFFD